MKRTGRQNYKRRDVGNVGLEDGDNILGSSFYGRGMTDFKNVGFFNYAFIDDYEKWFDKEYLEAVKLAFKCGVSAIHNKFWFIRARSKNKVYVKSFRKKKFIACWQ